MDDVKEDCCAQSSQAPYYYEEYIEFLRPPFLSVKDEDAVGVENPVSQLKTQFHQDLLMVDIATNAVTRTIKRDSTESDPIEFEHVEQSIVALIELWKLKWERTQQADLKLLRSSQDLVLAVNLSVVRNEGNLLKSDIMERLPRTVKFARLIVAAIDLLILSCKGDSTQEISAQVGVHFCLERESARSLLIALFQCLETLIKVFGVAKETDIRSPSTQDHLGGFADHIVTSLIAITKLCADPRIHVEVVCGAADEMMSMVIAGMDLFKTSNDVNYDQGVLEAATPHESKVELLVASCLLLMAQGIELSHVDFVDSTVKTTRGSDLLTVLASRTLVLSNNILNRPRASLMAKSHGESQLLRSVLWILKQMADHSVTRPLIMNQVAQILAQILLTEDDLFCKRWCGGEDSLSFYKFCPGHNRAISASSSTIYSLSSKIEMCITSLKLFDDAGEKHMQNVDLVRRAQEYSLERSVLVVHILWLLAKQAPGEGSKCFARELCRAVGALLESGLPLLSGAEVIWFNLNQIMDFLSPLQAFPKDTPVIGPRVFPALKCLAWDMKFICEEHLRALALSC